MSDRQKSQSTNSSQRNIPSIPLRAVFIIPFILQIFVAVAIAGYFSFKHSQKSIQNLAKELMGEVEGRIKQHLYTYLATPHQINQLNKNALDLKHIDFRDLRTMERHFWQQSKIFNRISYIQFGSVKGEFVGLEVNDNQTVRYQVTDFGKTLKTYSIKDNGDRDEFLRASPNYDPRNRPLV